MHNLHIASSNLLVIEFAHLRFLHILDALLNSYIFFLKHMKYVQYSDKKYIGKTKRLQQRSLTVQKSIDDSNKRIQNYHFQLVVWSMVGGISIITLLMLFRKFRKN